MTEAKELRVRAFYMWLNSQPSMRAPMNGVSIHALTAVGFYVGGAE